MQEIGDICDCRRPANTVDTKRVSFMHSRGALCHVKILIFFFGRRGGGGLPCIRHYILRSPKNYAFIFISRNSNPCGTCEDERRKGPLRAPFDWPHLLLSSAEVATWREQIARSKKTPALQATKFYTGRLRPKVQPLTLLYTIFERKGTPFVYLLLTNCTPLLHMTRTLHSF